MAAMLTLYFNLHSHAKRGHHRFGLRRKYGGHLHRARQSETAGGERRSRGRRATVSHHPGGELPGISGRHHRSGSGGEHEEAGGAFRRRVRARDGGRYRSLRAPVPHQRRRRMDRDAHGDHRLRRFGALAGPGIGTEADRPRRELLRHLRRLLLSRQEDHGGGRRRFGHGRGQLPHALRPRGDAGAPARGVSRFQDHARPRAPQSQDQVPHEHRGGRRLRRLARAW